MSNYTVQANWSEKDALATGDTNKRVRASEHATEYAAIASAIASKADQSLVETKANLESLSSTITTVTGLVSRVVEKTAPSTLQAGAHLTFTDNVKAKFGTSGDGLEIFHDGTDSILKDVGRGILKYTSDTGTGFGSVFEIENTSTNTYAGGYISFKGDTNDTPVKIGSSGSNILQLILNDAESHSFTPSGLKFREGSNLANIIVGTETPEGNVGAPVGSLFLRTDGGTGTSLYVKETGTNGNTGWVAK